MVFGFFGRRPGWARARVRELAAGRGDHGNGTAATPVASRHGTARHGAGACLPALYSRRFCGFSLGGAAAGSNAAPRDWNRNPPIGSGWLALACLAVVGVGGCGLWLGLALWLASGRRAGLIVWCRAHVDGAVLSCSCPVAWPLDNGGYNCTFAAGRLGRPGCNCNCNCGSDT